MGSFERLADLQPIRIWEGARARAVAGQRMTLAVIDLDPHCQILQHQHEQEQLGLVLKGVLTLTVAGESRTLGPGETYVIPSNVPHSASTGGEGASVVDIFSPPRSDWDGLERLEPGPPAWPA